MQDPSDPSLNITFKGMVAVAQWNWIASDDSCGICKLPFVVCCSSCTPPNDDCLLVWGQCTHTFHEHCLLKWFEVTEGTSNQCPICRQNWVKRT